MKWDETNASITYGVKHRRKHALGWARHAQEMRAFTSYGAGQDPRDYRFVRHSLDAAVEAHGIIRHMLRPFVDGDQKLTAADIRRIAFAADATPTMVRTIRDGMIARLRS